MDQDMEQIKQKIMKNIEHNEKLLWMLNWATKNNAALNLRGECGFSRECVGIMADGIYPDYEWYDGDYERIDDNGEVWVPDDAYHKHPCVAVLGRGEIAEAQLYDWLKWFDDNNFHIETGEVELDPNLDSGMRGVFIMMGKDRFVRMVRGK